MKNDQLSKIKSRLKELEPQLSDPALFSNPKKLQEINREYSRLKDTADLADKISALQNLSYNDAKNSLGMKGNFNITACEYSFGRHIPDTVNVMASAYPIIVINSSGAVKPT